MSAWSAPLIEWDAVIDDEAHYARLVATGDHLTRWPAAPFEHTPTDCFKLGPDYWIWQPGVGGIRFSAPTPSLTAYPVSTVDPAWFEEVVTRSWMPAVYQAWGRQVLHASAVARHPGGDVIVFTGPSGAGKSTLAYSLAQRPGWAHVADDTLAFSVVGGRISLHPLPNDARLRPATAAYHGRTDDPVAPVTWPDLTLSLARLYVIGGVADLPHAAAIEPVKAVDSYTLLLEQAHAFTLRIPAFNQQLMRDYLTLAAGVPAFRLTYRRHFDDLNAVLDRVEQHGAERIAS